MFYNDWKAFQDWYCERFQRPNPLPWQDGMQALLWFIKKGLPSNTTVTVTAGQGVETGVNITGDGTPESPYKWDFRINTQPIIDAAALSVLTPERLAEKTNNNREGDIGAVGALAAGDKVDYTLNARTTFLITNAVQAEDFLPALFAKLEGSETVVVDVNEAGTALEVHIDALVMQKINRALLAPVSAPAERSVVAVDTNNSEVLIPVSQLGGGGGGGAVYRHVVELMNVDSNYYAQIVFYSTSSERILTAQQLQNISTNLYGALCRVRAGSQTNDTDCVAQFSSTQFLQGDFLHIEFQVLSLPGYLTIMPSFNQITDTVNQI